MKNDNVISLETPAKDEDLLTNMLRQGAQELLTKAVQAELTEFLAQYQDVIDEQGRRAVVRNGYLPQREIMTGLGPVDIEVPKTRDRSREGRHFSSALLPPYIKRTKSIETLLPWLYLKGISTGDFSEALAALLGKEAKGISAGTISRLKQVWHQEYAVWRKRDLSRQEYVYIWADGVYFNIRGDESKQCILVIIGVTAQGNKEFLAITDGYRESEQSWREVLLELKSRGLNSPKLAIGDGALGFWKALQKVFGKTRSQRCWVHKTANVLNKMPKSVQPKAKQHLQDIWMAETRKDAENAWTQFLATYQDKYPKACECLEKDQEQMLAFYDFPAEHWVHIRTSNPIESTFATVRLRTAKTRGCVSRTTVLTMVFKLGLSAEKGWRKLRGFRRLAEVINGVKFIDGIDEKTIEEQRKAA
ncbi:MAG: IS256 family transposase [Candidatus Marinimicrobia bacterium]|jgi:transposase-like protein|nr:IS256 family transposase [Candidatus Neomarinimicrobiota bacterium]